MHRAVGRGKIVLRCLSFARGLDVEKYRNTRDQLHIKPTLQYRRTAQGTQRWHTEMPEMTGVGRDRRYRQRQKQGETDDTDRGKNRERQTIQTEAGRDRR